MKALLFISIFCFGFWYLMPFRGERPNVFVTFHVRNKQILSKIGQIQDQLLTKSSDFRQFLKPLPSMHITSVLTKVGDDDLERLKLALQEAATTFRAAELKNRTMEVHFEGIGEFSKHVLYGDIQKSDVLMLRKLFVTIKSEFEKQGFPSLGEFNPYNPHVTLVDLNAKYFALSRLWSDMLGPEFEFGVEEVRTLQICSMKLNKTVGDYEMLAEIEL